MFTTQGGSMMPAILPGSVLQVRLAAGQPLAIGDIVCFPAQERLVIAHRIVGLHQEGSAPPHYWVRGDAQPKSELINAEAIAFVVERIDGWWWSYRVDSPLGRLETHLALHHPRWWRSRGKALWKWCHRWTRFHQRLRALTQVT